MTMSTTTKILAAVAVGGAVYFVMRKPKAATTTSKILTGGGPPADVGGTSKPTGGNNKAPPLPFPEANVAQEKVLVDQVYTVWANEDLEEDVAMVKNGQVTLHKLSNELTTVAFLENYPTWSSGPGFPTNWKSSPGWAKWADAWNRMHARMVDLVSQKLSQYGV